MKRKVEAGKEMDGGGTKGSAASNISANEIAKKKDLVEQKITEKLRQEW